MPWYRFYCSHGPGHQGTSEKYEYYTNEWASPEDLKEEWHEWCRQEWFEHAIGDVELVQELPESERKFQIQKYRDRANSALMMLLILGAEEV